MFPNRKDHESTSKFKIFRYAPSEAPIYLSSAVLIAIGAIGLISVAQNTAGSHTFPNMSNQAMTFAWYCFGGLAMQLVARLISRFLLQKKTMKTPLIERDRLSNLKYVIAFGGIGFAIVVTVQAMVLSFRGAIFQVTATDVYAYFVFGAVAEEAFFRTGLLVIIQLAFAALMMKVFEIKSEMLVKVVSSAFAIIVSSLLFTFSHSLYLEDFYLMMATMLSSIILSVIFILSGHPLASMIAHMLVNFITAGQWVQFL